MDKTLRQAIRKQIDTAVNEVYYNFLTAMNKTGDDLYIHHDYEEAVDKLTDSLVFMIENNPSAK